MPKEIIFATRRPSPSLSATARSCSVHERPRGREDAAANPNGSLREHRGYLQPRAQRDGTDATSGQARSKRRSARRRSGGISFADSIIGAAGDGFCLVEPIFLLATSIGIFCRRVGARHCRAPTERKCSRHVGFLSRRLLTSRCSKLKSESHRNSRLNTASPMKSTRASRKFLGANRNFTELRASFSVMWSEHCSYKSSKVHFAPLADSRPSGIAGTGRKRGCRRISGMVLAAAFKMESHNHPSYVEPFQGAATGVGGFYATSSRWVRGPIACTRFVADSGRSFRALQGLKPLILRAGMFAAKARFPKIAFSYASIESPDASFDIGYFRRIPQVPPKNRRPRSWRAGIAAKRPYPEAGFSP